MASASPVKKPRKPRAADDRDFLLRIPPNATTLAGFRAWVQSDEFPEKLRCAFVDGEIYLDMSKEDLESHNKVKAEVFRVLLNLNKEQALGEFYQDGALLTNKKATVSTNPDGVFIKHSSLASGRVKLLAGKAEESLVEIEGTPDWVMEIVSASSVRKDTRTLRAAYHRAGIPEYWLIDARGKDISFQILTWTASGYTRRTVADGWQASPVFGRSFRLTRVKNAIGLWDYTLETRKARGAAR